MNNKGEITAVALLAIISTVVILGILLLLS